MSVVLLVASQEASPPSGRKHFLSVTLISILQNYGGIFVSVAGDDFKQFG